MRRSLADEDVRAAEGVPLLDGMREGGVVPRLVADPHVPADDRVAADVVRLRDGVTAEQRDKECAADGKQPEAPAGVTCEARIPPSGWR